MIVSIGLWLLLTSFEIGQIRQYLWPPFLERRIAPSGQLHQTLIGTKWAAAIQMANRIRSQTGSLSITDKARLAKSVTEAGKHFADGTFTHREAEPRK